MPYAITGYFNEEADRIIRDIWKSLSEKGISEYLHHSRNHPHIKFAVFDELDVQRTQKRLEAFAEQNGPLRLHFKNYGLYPNEKPVLFLDIAATTGILELQTAIRRQFGGLGLEMQVNYFDPGIWKPDCYLTTAFDRSRLGEAVELLYGTPLPLDGYLERLGLIEYYPAERLGEYKLQG